MRWDQLSPNLCSAIAFLKEVGLSVTVVPAVEPGFVDGCRIVDGALLLTPSCQVSTLLHEAGHLAIVPADYRSWINDDVEEGIAKIFELSGVQDIHPDHPFSRALIQCSDVEATAWAWAAGKAVGLREKDIIQDHEYGGAGGYVRILLRGKSYLGIHGLVHAGMCLFPDRGGYPLMQKWIQDADRHAAGPYDFAYHQKS